jgi:hypothetical protein
MATLYKTSQFFVTTLNVGGGITNSQTTGIIIADDSGIDDTTEPGIALLSYSDPLNTTNAEWVTFTSIVANELQGVTRGAEGYSAKTHDNGVQVAFPLSMSHINNLAAALSIGGVYTNAVTTTLDEDDMASNSATALATQQSIKKYVDDNAGSEGWQEAGETWVYASADDPTFTFTVAGVDLTSKYSPGMRIKLTQTTAKYFIITAVAFSTDTTITVYGGTDYDLANEVITSPFFSSLKAPHGFPLDPSKWTVEVIDTTSRSQASPTNNVWYNVGTTNSQITVPIGVWQLGYDLQIQLAHGSAAILTQQTALSTANNSVSNASFVVESTISNNDRNYTYMSRSRIVSVASKTLYYLICRTTNSNAEIGFRGGLTPTILQAVCAYL